MRSVILFIAAAVCALPAMAAAVNSVVFSTAAVPALDDVGLIALTLVVAVAGGIAVRRRNRNRK